MWRRSRAEARILMCTTPKSCEAPLRLTRRNHCTPRCDNCANAPRCDNRASLRQLRTLRQPPRQPRLRLRLRARTRAPARRRTATEEHKRTRTKSTKASAPAGACGRRSAARIRATPGRARERAGASGRRSAARTRATWGKASAAPLKASAAALAWATSYIRVA